MSADPNATAFATLTGIDAQDEIALTMALYELDATGLLRSVDGLTTLSLASLELEHLRQMTRKRQTEIGDHGDPG